MALITNVLVDKIEVLSNGLLQVRQAIQVMDGTNMVGESFIRWTCNPGDDVSTQDPQVQAIATALWTPEVIAAYKESLILPVIPTNTGV